MIHILFAAIMLQSALTASPTPYAIPGEESVDPYEARNANAGATPFKGEAMAKAFHGQDGIRRVVKRFAALNFDDPVIVEIFKGHDRARFERTVFEQFCYILNAGCDYTGRNMASSHKNLGSQQGDLNKVVENLQRAMKEEDISFAAQNRFLSKLAPMSKDVVNR